VLGPCHDFHRPGEIPEFKLPDWVYKPSTLFNDCVLLYAGNEHHLHNNAYLVAPWASKGVRRHPRKMIGSLPFNDVIDHDLHAVNIGDIVTFNRPLRGDEKRRIAVTDVQRRIKLFHVCGSDCEDDCELAEELMLTEIPDPNYVIMRTAALHAEGSPPAQGRVSGLQDNAQKLLSAMRQNDAAATSPDTVEWEPLNFIKVF
jgi:hypothetical protein